MPNEVAGFVEKSGTSFVENSGTNFVENYTTADCIFEIQSAANKWDGINTIDRNNAVGIRATARPYKTLVLAANHFTDDSRAI